MFKEILCRIQAHSAQAAPAQTGEIDDRLSFSPAGRVELRGHTAARAYLAVEFHKGREAVARSLQVLRARRDRA
jgi:hypothetical protein